MTPVPAWSTPRTAIVTGGGSGIGIAIATRLAQDGASIAIFDRNGDGANATADAIVADGGTAIGVTVDVSSRDQIEAGVAEVRDRLGAATILINNAGISPFSKFLKITQEEFEQVFAVNVRGIFDLCQVVLPDMIEAGWGRIVNISSSSAQTGNAGQVHYSASKGAVISMTRSLAKEFGPKGITVNAVPPSFVDTPSLRSAEDSGMLGPGVEVHEKSTPVRRVGKPDDIAAACAFFARDDSSYITGQVLGVNGGRVIV